VQRAVGEKEKQNHFAIKMSRCEPNRALRFQQTPVKGTETVVSAVF